ncbi:MAG: hypothetical protein ACREQE_02595 [Candidatus Binataceae bacterium]
MIASALMEQRMRRRTGWAVGAIRLGLADVITALLVLALLVWASWWQFPAYQHKFAAPSGGVRSRATSGALAPRTRLSARRADA